MESASVLSSSDVRNCQTVFVFSGEGTHSSSTDISLLRTSPSWSSVLAAIRDLGHADAEGFIKMHLGSHVAPNSLVVTVAINMLNADLWKYWGQKPDVVVGHSVGEIAAAYAAGMLSPAEAINTAHALGKAMSDMQGAMLHTEMPRSRLSQFPTPDGISVSAINYVVQPGGDAGSDILSVSLCGPIASVDAYLTQDPASAKLKPEHPWHHASVSRTLALSPSSGKAQCRFVSALTGTDVTEVGRAHWEEWLRTPVNFELALTKIVAKPSVVVEMGAHPVMAAAVRAQLGKDLLACVSSMRRGEGTLFVRTQRAALPTLDVGLEVALENFRVDLPSRGAMVVQHSVDFSEQGLASQQLVLLASSLSSFFPGLAAHDLYRFTSLSKLIHGWDHSLKSAEASHSTGGTCLEVLGCAARLPAGVDSPSSFWSLLQNDDQNSAFSAVPKGAPAAAYLCPRFGPQAAAAAAEAVGCEGAEAVALDPQHAFALALAREMWRDAGEVATAAAQKNPNRVGVYIGAWQSAVASGGRPSAYGTIGSSLSALASRVANAYNLQGPVVTVNTACSSALVAVDNALRDAKAGRIDFAIVGGVNLLGEEQTLFTDLSRAGMLSRTSRCHTFSAKADGYVRAEGGVLMLLQAGSTLPSRARILGSAVTQNSTRKPLSAVDPIAQERVINLACADAGVSPSQLSVVEMHGTGTPLGDPVEVSALARVTARREGAHCAITAVKMHVGHLESAAGGVGLLKAVLMCEQQCVPAFSVDDALNSQVVAAMDGSCLQTPGTKVALDARSLVGVSSFGFAGSNAHVIVAPTPMDRALPQYDMTKNVVQAPAMMAEPTLAKTTVLKRVVHRFPASTGDTSESISVVADAVSEISGYKGVVDLDTELAELGVDSLGLAELLARLEDRYGAGCLTVDIIMDGPTVRAVARHLSGLKLKEPPATKVLDESSSTAVSGASVDYSGAIEVVTRAISEISGLKRKTVELDVDLAELGVDSLGLAELLGRLEDSYGVGCLTVDKIMDVPTARAIGNLLAGLKQKDTTVVQEACESTAAPSALRSVPSEESFPVSSSAPLYSAHIYNSDTLASTKPVPSETKPLAQKVEHGWIRTTHVGSLPRPTDGNLDLSQIVSRQLAAGIHVVNDGEWTRENYIADVIDRIEGLRGGAEETQDGCCAKHSMPVADDMLCVPQYATRFTGGNGLITLNPKREAVSDLACVAHPRYVVGSSPNLQPFLDAMEKARRAPGDAFYSVPSPGTLALFCKDLFFHNHGSYVQALGEALSQEFAQIAATGVQLQVDCPDLAMGRHTRWSSLSDSEFIEIARLNVEALNVALRDVPFEQIRVHVCWGNYAGPHHKDLPADLVWPVLGTVKAKFLLMEGANPRHRQDVAAFERAVKNGHFSTEQVIVPGLVDTTAARVESPDLIADSLLRYIAIAGHPSRVMAATDCGFASTAKSTAITADIVWMKLESLAAGARIATTSLLQLEAPVPCRSPTLLATPIRVAVFAPTSDAPFANGVGAALQALRVHSVEIIFQDHFEAVRWAVDVPLAIVGIGQDGAALAEQTFQRLQDDASVARRPVTIVSVGVTTGGGVLVPRGSVEEVAAAVRDASMPRLGFDKRQLVITQSKSPPRKVDVIVVGAGLLGMVTAKRCLDAGFSVAVLEQRMMVGGIWSMYANGTSQVNSSEGGYCLKDIIGERASGLIDNRDHSTAAEVLTDMAVLGEVLQPHIYTGVKVLKILGKDGDYSLLFEDTSGTSTVAGVTDCRGCVLCINDRVGLPRALAAPGREKFAGVVADGTADSLADMDWRGKRVVIAGMGAFAVENLRTALENGAAEVTVVGRRMGTICPKAIDYLNFVKPWDQHFKHDTTTNVKQFLRWKELYAAAGCVVPECWPKQVKHDGHTISVSDVWFIGHHMKKLSTRTGTISSIEQDGAVLDNGEFIACEVIVGCIGFHRSNYLCEALTGRTEVKTTNYLDRDMMYLADAEIDEGAFNSFLGSSVLEYGKFFTNVYVEGLKRGNELGEQLWGSETISVPISERKWNQYIASGAKLIANDAGIAHHAREQVRLRTEHFWRTLPPQSFLKTNLKEWEELHQRLNNGVHVPKEKQLPYFFTEAPDWC